MGEPEQTRAYDFSGPVTPSQDNNIPVRPEQPYDESLKIGSETMSPQVQKTFSCAQEKAQRFHHNYIGTEHVLLALLDENQREVEQILSELGVQRGNLSQILEQALQPGKHIQLGQVPITQHLNRALAFAVEESHLLQHDVLYPEHLLVGIAREGDGVAGQVLSRQGITFEKLRGIVL